MQKCSCGTLNVTRWRWPFFDCAMDMLPCNLFLALLYYSNGGIFWIYQLIALLINWFFCCGTLNVYFMSHADKVINIFKMENMPQNSLKWTNKSNIFIQKTKYKLYTASRSLSMSVCQYASLSACDISAQ